MFVVIGQISLVSSLLGLGAVGVLLALHYLKTQPARRAVATLIFWQQSTREQRSRMLWSKRFTHWRTFFLLSLIALLLALSLSADRWGRNNEVNCVIVIDTGAPMAGSGDGRPSLDAAIDAVRRDVKGLSSSPTLIAAGSSPLVVSRAGVAPRIMSDKLGHLTCGSEASNAASALELANTLLGNRDGTIEWYTDRSDVPAGLPSEVAKRVRVRRAPPAARAVVIAGVTFSPMGEAGPNGLLRIRLSGRSDTQATLNVTAGGIHRSQPVGLIAGQTDVTFDDIAADGQTAVVELVDAPGAPATHVARFELPNWPTLRFYSLGDISRPLRAALAAIGSEATSPVGAVVVTSPDKAPKGAGTRAIVVFDAGVSETTTAKPITVAAGAPSAIRAIDFEGATAAASQSIPPSARPLLVAGSVIMAGMESGPDGQRLYLSTSLVGNTADLPRSAAFPELIARLVSELQGGRPAAPVVSAERRAIDPLWPLFPSAASSVTVIFAAPVTTSAGDSSPADLALLRDAPGATRWPWETLLLVAGLTLLIGEGLLLAAKKII